MKNILIVLLCLNFLFVSFTARANSYAGGWSQTDVIRQGATSIYNGMKRDGDNLMRGVAKFTPTVGMVAKAIVRGGAVGAVLTAVEVLINTTQVELIQEGNQHYFRSTVGQYCTMDRKNCFADKSAAENYAKRIWSEGSWAEYAFQGCKISEDNNILYFCYFAKGDDRRVTAFIIDRPKVTVEAVAGQVIADANSGSADARRYVGTVADAEVTQEDKVRGWNETAVSANPADTGANAGTANPSAGANAGTAEGAGEGAENPPKTNNPPAEAPPAPSFELPAFCGWASIVCEIPVLMKEYWGKAVNAVSEFFTPNKNENTEVDIENIANNVQPTDTTVRFGGGCPADISLANFSFYGQQVNWDFSFRQICDFLSTWVKPVVITMATFSSILIVAGVRNDD